MVELKAGLARQADLQQETVTRQVFVGVVRVCFAADFRPHCKHIADVDVALVEVRKDEVLTKAAGAETVRSRRELPSPRGIM